MKKLSLTLAFAIGILLLGATTNSYAQIAPQLSISKPEPLVQPANGRPAADSAPSTSIRISCSTPIARLSPSAPATSQYPPLYVVDGTPITEERLKTLEPNQIEKIEVLKDSKAVVLYGPLAVNGAVLITIKK